MSAYRILHLIASSRGGGTTHVRDLALGLDPAHFATRVAMPDDGGQFGPADFAAAGIPCEPVAIASGFSPGALAQVRRLDAQADMLHVHGARAALFGRLAALSLGRRRPRVVYIIQGFALPFYPWLQRAALATLERLLAPTTDQVIAVSAEEQRAYLGLHTLPAERTCVIPNSVALGPFQAAAGQRTAMREALGLAPDALVITTICRLYKPRDFETLLEAFSQLCAARGCAAPGGGPLVLLIVGDGPDGPQVEALRDRLGLGEHVRLTGQRRDVPALLAASDIYTLTTWGWEGLPFTVLEAMAAARPVVATHAGGTAEAVEQGETGVLVPRCDAAALEAALDTLVADAALRERMGAAGRARAAECFSPARTLELTAQLYERVLEGRTR